MRATSYRQAFRARRFAIVAVTLLVACLAVLAPPEPRSFHEPSTKLEDVASPAHARYQATAAIGVPPINSGGDATIQFKTIAFYVQSTAVGELFAQQLGYTGRDFAMLGRLIEAEADEKSGILTVAGFGGTKQQAADVTNAFVQALRDYLSGLATQATEQSLQQARTSVDDLKRRMDELSAQITELRLSLQGQGEGAAQTDPRVAVLEAERDALGVSYTAAYQNLTRVSAGGTGLSTAGLTVLQAADAATAKEKPPSFLYELWVRVLVGMLVGLALGAALALLLEHNARKIFGRESAELAFGARVLAEIPRQRRVGTSREVAVVTAPGSRAAAAYRMLRVILLYEHTFPSGNGTPTLPEQRRPAPAEAVTATRVDVGTTRESSATRAGSEVAHGSPDAGRTGDEPSGNGHPRTPVEPAASSSGGTHDPSVPRSLALVVAATANEPAHSAVVANLAASFAESGRSVAVLRMRSSVRRVNHREADHESPGQVPRDQATSVEGVRIVEWEPSYGGPAPSTVVQRLRENGAVVLVDAGRVATAEFAEIAPVIDGVVVVCQIGRTTIENAERTADIVAWSRARLLGVVMTQVSANPVERVTWGRHRRSPLTSRSRLSSLNPWLSPTGSQGGRRRGGAIDDGPDGDQDDDPLAILPGEGAKP